MLPSGCVNSMGVGLAGTAIAAAVPITTLALNVNNLISVFYKYTLLLSSAKIGNELEKFNKNRNNIDKYPFCK